MNNEGNTNNIFGVDMGEQPTNNNNNQGINIPSMDSLNNFTPLQGVNNINSGIPFEQPINNSVSAPNNPLPTNTPLPGQTPSNIPNITLENTQVIPNTQSSPLPTGNINNMPNIPMESNEPTIPIPNIPVENNNQAIPNNINNIPMENITVNNNELNTNINNSLNNGMIPLNLDMDQDSRPEIESTIPDTPVVDNQISPDNNIVQDKTEKKSKGFIIYLIICGIIIVLGLIAFFVIKTIKNKNSDNYVDEETTETYQLMCTKNDNNTSEEYIFEFSDDNKTLLSVYRDKVLTYDGDGTNEINSLTEEKNSLSNSGITSDIIEGDNAYYLTYNISADEFKKLNPDYNLSSIDNIKTQFSSLGYTCE